MGMRIAWFVWSISAVALLYALFATDPFVAVVFVGPFYLAMLYISDKKRKAL